MQWLGGLIDYGVIGLLVLLCFISVMLAAERILFYRKLDVTSFKSKKQLELILSKNIQFIGTVAGNAPYVGLLGTVLGIMLSFYNIGATDNINTKEIMVDLALALKATAVGLVVAIVAVVLYNILMKKTRSIMLEWEIANEG